MGDSCIHCGRAEQCCAQRLAPEMTKLERELAEAREWGLKMLRERDSRIAPQRCLSCLRPHDSPDGPPCQKMGEFQCVDCGGWVCRNHAEFHFAGSERSKLKTRAEAAERDLDALRTALRRIFAEFTPQHIDRVSGTLVGSDAAALLGPEEPHV